MEKETKFQTLFKNKNPKRKLFGLWYIVDDYESAKEAANLAKYINGGLLAFSVFLLFPLNEILYKPDDFDSFLPQLAKFLQVVIPIWFAFRLHQEKYGVVPWVAIIGAIEGARYAWYIQPGVGVKIIVMLIILSMSINSYRGWQGLKRINTPTEKERDFYEQGRKSDWQAIAIFIAFVLLCLVLVGSYSLVTDLLQ
jgi:hypothetical protein